MLFLGDNLNDNSDLHPYALLTRTFMLGDSKDTLPAPHTSTRRSGDHTAWFIRSLSKRHRLGASAGPCLTQHGWATTRARGACICAKQSSTAPRDTCACVNSTDPSPAASGPSAARVAACIAQDSVHSLALGNNPKAKRSGAHFKRNNKSRYRRSGFLTVSVTAPADSRSSITKVTPTA